MSDNHLLELAQDIVRRALEAGATGAECTISEGEEFSASVRMREVENLKQAGSRGAGLRVLVGQNDRLILHIAICRREASNHGPGIGASIWPISRLTIRTPACPSRPIWARSTAT